MQKIISNKLHVFTQCTYTRIIIVQTETKTITNIILEIIYILNKILLIL